MSIKADPNLMKDLKHFGLQDASKCFNCGNCTAVCPLSTPDNPFPRKWVRYAQLGMKEKILHSPEPWLCYYCGTCSEKCPRGADPSETMMVMRRYLTSLYDWTGFSRRFYTSERFEIMAIAAVAAFVGLLMLVFNGGFVTDAVRPDGNLLVSLNTAWPPPAMEFADIIMGTTLAFLLLSNVWRCIKFIMGDTLTQIPLRIYLGQAKDLVVHFLTQKRFGECEDRTQWIIHLLIMTGYVTVFLLVVIFLAGGLHILGIYWDEIAFQRDKLYPFFHPVRLLGYYATVAILIGTGYAVMGRIKKSKPPYKNSHPTDWMFLVLLILTTVTGILVHVGRRFGWPTSTYTMYVIHMMVAIPMLVLEVPFAKWAHLAYRPVSIYLLNVKKAWAAEQAAVVEPAAEEKLEAAS